MRKIINKPISKGDVFNELTVLDSRAHKYERINSAGVKVNSWARKCLCSCGKIAYVNSGALTFYQRSCGHIRDSYLSVESLLKNKIKQIKVNATKRNIIVTLSDEQIAELVVLPCFYCNRAPNHKYINETSKDKYHFNSIDRLNNNRGYTPLNSVPCCALCNIAKQTESLSVFLGMIKTIYENLQLQYLDEKGISQAA